MEGCIILLILLIIAIPLAPPALAVWLSWRLTRRWWVVVITFLALTVGPFWHVLSQHMIFAVMPRTQQKIDAKIEAPESVLLLDDSYSVYYHSTLETYLDGTHVKTLALKERGDAVTLYRADADPFAETRRCSDEALKKWQAVDFDAMNRAIHDAEKNGEDAAALKAHQKQLAEEKDADWKACADLRGEARRHLRETRQTFDSAADLPPMRYTVRETRKGCGHRLSLYRREQMDIVDNASGKVIAWARSYEGCLSWWQDMLSGEAYRPTPVQGPGVHDKRAFRDQVLAPHAKPFARELNRWIR